MPKRQIINKTERVGVNYVRSLFEAENCIFKEIPKDYDYGHDAIIGLVDGEKVLPKEIAVQVKSGKSYITNSGCRIYCSPSQQEYWNKHPLDTYGIVYDPEEKCAYSWLLKDAEYEKTKGGNIAINFPKSEWNRLTTWSLKHVWLPYQIRGVIDLTFDQANEWAQSSDNETSFLGLRTLMQTHATNPKSWIIFFKIFETQGLPEIDPVVLYYLAKNTWHPDSGGITVPNEIKKVNRQRISKYSYIEILKLLHFIDEDGYERGSLGQCIGALITSIECYDDHLRHILTIKGLHEELYHRAEILLHHRDDLPF